MAVYHVGSLSYAQENPYTGTWYLPSGWESGDIAVFWVYTSDYRQAITEPGTITQVYDVASLGYGDFLSVQGYCNQLIPICFWCSRL